MSPLNNLPIRLESPSLGRSYASSSCQGASIQEKTSKIAAFLQERFYPELSLDKIAQGVQVEEMGDSEAAASVCKVFSFIGPDRQSHTFEDSDAK